MAKLPRLLPLIAIAIGGVVAVRAVGAGPGLFEGAKAWAEEAMPTAAAAAPVRPVPPVCALTPEQLAQQAGISPAELRIIQSLSSRRKELDSRDTDFETTLPLMVAAEQKLDAKIQTLNAIKAEVQVLLGQVDDKEKAETDRLVAVYSAMRPREAAAIFTSLDDSVRLPIAAAMRPRSLSAVMAQMPPAAARELTEKLARRYQAQQLAARAAVASAVTAPPPAAPATQTATVTPPAPTATPAAATPAAATPAAASPAAATTPPPAPRPAARAASRPPARPAARPPTAPATPAPKPAAAAPAGPRPYAPPTAASTSAPAPTTPRQSVE